MTNQKKKQVEVLSQLQSILKLLGHETQISSEHYLDEAGSHHSYRHLVSCYYQNYNTHHYELTISHYKSNGREQKFTRVDGDFDFHKIANKIAEYLTSKAEIDNKQKLKRTVVEDRILQIETIAKEFEISFQDSYDHYLPAQSGISLSTYDIEKVFSFTVKCMTIEEAYGFLQAYKNRVQPKNLPQSSSNIVSLNPFKKD